MSESQAEQNDQEPTMEEILSSIRRIISDDDKDSAETSPTVAPTVKSPAMGEEGETYYDQNDIVDLTEMIQDDGSKVKLNKDGNPESSADIRSDTDLNDPKKVEEKVTNNPEIREKQPTITIPKIEPKPI